MGDRERRREELFEDLDRFFGSTGSDPGREPRREGAWGRGPVSGGTEGAREPGGGTEGARAAGGPAGGAADEGADLPEEELLPEGWFPDVEGVDLGGEEEAPTGPARAAEMSGEEWGWPRQAMARGDGPEEAGSPTARFEPPEGAGGPPSGREGPGPEEEAGELAEEPPLEEVEATAERLAREYRAEPEEPEDDLLADLRAPARRTVQVGPGSMTGPAWEEPGAAVPVEPAAGWGGRNMVAAVLTAAVLGAAAVVSLALAPAAFAFVAGAVALLGQAELYASLQRRGHQPATALGLVVGGLAMAAAYLRGEGAMAFLVALGLGLAFLWYMAAPPRAREGLVTNVALTVAGVVYVPVLAAFLLMVLARPDSPRALTVVVLGLTFLYDSAAFVVGSLWGERPLAPTISPRKSWEGLVGATVVVFIVAVALVSQVRVGGAELGLARAVGLALLVSVFAPLGDLAESALKRDLGLKDMGAVLPGHGGVLDRIDSLLFVAPAAFYFFKIFL
jgi:phosphatidate cytidylyltransferase